MGACKSQSQLSRRRFRNCNQSALRAGNVPIWSPVKMVLDCREIPRAGTSPPTVWRPGSPAKSGPGSLRWSTWRTVLTSCAGGRFGQARHRRSGVPAIFGRQAACRPQSWAQRPMHQHQKDHRRRSAPGIPIDLHERVATALTCTIMAKIKQPRWGWALTGSGHFFKECLYIIGELDKVDLFVTRAAARSSACIEQWRPFRSRRVSFATPRPAPRRSAHSTIGIYHTLVLAPATSNTVAKCVYGISDTLATNVFAQAGKCRVFSIVFACDTAPELETEAPKGMVKVYPRQIDLENTARLKSFKDVNGGRKSGRAWRCAYASKRELA